MGGGPACCFATEPEGLTKIYILIYDTDTLL